LGSFSGGITCYVRDEVLSCQYNLFEIQRTRIKAREKLPVGKVRIEFETTCVEPKLAGPLKVVMKVNGKEVASGVVPIDFCMNYGKNIHRARVIKTINFIEIFE